MAVVVVNQMDGADQDTYERISSKVMPDGQLPDGCQLHIAGGTEGGWRVITVWESDERFQTFREQKLMPAMQERAIKGASRQRLRRIPFTGS
jgi:hypothetical protein